MSAARPTQRATVQTWLIRAGIAIVAGLLVGGAGGVMGVNRLDPGRPGQPDSLQLLLDDQQRREDAQSPLSLRRAADSADAERRARRAADSIALANDPTAPLVPNLVGMEEGDARDAIEEADLVVGSVIFRADNAAAGTVLESKPPAGRKLRSGSPVDLVLSDGRVAPPDTARAESLRADSMRADSIRTDSLRAAPMPSDSARSDSVSADRVRVVPPPSATHVSR